MKNPEKRASEIWEEEDARLNDPKKKAEALEDFGAAGLEVEKNPENKELMQRVGKQILEGEGELDKRNEKMREIRERSKTDELTGLLNRRGLNEEFQKVAMQMERRKKPVAILMIDLNGFKKVNDNLGHEAGDETLKRVAKVMKDLVRLGDDVVVRWGGDEFVILLTDPKDDMTEERGMKVGRRLNEALMKEFEGDERFEGLSASVGVNLCCAGMEKNHRQELQEALGKADKAMFVAKDHKGGDVEDLVKGFGGLEKEDDGEKK